MIQCGLLCGLDLFMLDLQSVSCVVLPLCDILFEPCKEHSKSLSQQQNYLFVNLVNADLMCKLSANEQKNDL